MKRRGYFLGGIALNGLVVAGLFSACATIPRRPKSCTRDRAFIVCLPHKDRGPLRLAVKDNIDLRGLVTTAGSEM